MPYTRTNWQNGVTPLNADNMNNIEDGIQDALQKVNTAGSNISALQTTVAGKVDKQTTSSGTKAYAYDSTGDTSVDVSADNANGNTLVMRTGSGRIVCADPTNPSHAATKRYVQDYAVQKTNLTYKVYGTNQNGAQVALDFAGGSASANSIARRTSDGQLIVSDPTANGHAATKKYVDDRVQANPTGTATTDLTKLKIGSTTYNIPSGGGSAGVSSIGGKTGAITLSRGLSIDNSNVLSGPDLSGYLTSASAASTYAPKPASGSYVVADTDGDISVKGITATDDVVIGTLSIDPTAESAPDYGGNHVSVSTWGNNLALKAFGPQNSTNQGVLSLVSARQDGGKSSRMIFNADGSVIIQRSFAQGESDPQNLRFDINGFDVYVNGTQIGGNPCLIAGTKISMADGATKNIEDVKVGDLVKSWNPTTKELCDAVVILSEKTGEENVFTNYIFDDGNNLVIYGDHGYYNPCFRHIRNIQDDKNKDFHVLNQDIKIQQCIVRDKYMHHGDKIGRYNIATSNNLYFANNILCGQSPYAKYNYYIKHSIELPEDIQAVCLADTNDYNEWNSLMNNSAYLKESADARNRRVKAHIAEMAARKELESLDYKTLKHSEGVLTEEEFNQVIVRKEELRAIVNEQHELFMTAYNEVKEIEKKYRTITYDQLFRNCCDRDNEALQLFKDWLQPKGE